MIEAATIGMFLSVFGMCAYEDNKYQHDDERAADVNYQYDPTFYQLDKEDNTESKCATCSTCK